MFGNFNKTPGVVDFFDGTAYDWLSNFHPCEIDYDGRLWRTSEHAYQAMKFADRDKQEAIRALTSPGAAKHAGKTWPGMRYNWDTVKFDIMIDLLRIKFAQPLMGDRLLATGSAKLIEGNTWGDRIWGVCDGVGDNNLGRSLMLVRAEVRAERLARALHAERAKREEGR